MTMKMFVPITKVDEAKRLVYGRAVQEVVDRIGEKFRYAESKPYFETWSKSFSEATDGKSLGNIRAMHGKVSAGIVKEIDFRDTEKAIDIVTHINDDQEWKKVLDGNYTGFSIGGSYIGEKKTEKIDGEDVTWYTANPSEISIVDSPCIPTAKFFEVIKADGAVEKVNFKPALVEVQGTDEQVAQFGEALNKGGFTLADAIGFVNKAAADKGKAPDDLLVIINEAVRIGSLHKQLSDPSLPFSEFVKIAQKELSEDELKALKGSDSKAIVEAILGKAKMSAANMDRLQAAHDHIAAMGAKCGEPDADDGKAVGADLKKIVGDAVMAELTATKERLAKLEAQPMPHVITLRAVKKGEEGGNSKDADPLTSMPLEKLVRFPDGTVDWKASEAKLGAGA